MYVALSRKKYSKDLMKLQVIKLKAALSPLAELYFRIGNTYATYCLSQIEEIDRK